MMRSLFPLLVMLAFALPARAQLMTACDYEASHPSDPAHVGPGVSSRDVNTERAITACRWAVDNYPEEARFHYQLGRAMVYQADRAKADWHPGMPHVKKAAEMRHTQAMFVLSLLYQRDEQWCEAEPWLRAAAEEGLKAARISYVNEVLSGRLESCGELVEVKRMAEYLEGARGQVNGWYEAMLLESLERGLEVIK